MKFFFILLFLTSCVGKNIDELAGGAVTTPTSTTSSGGGGGACVTSAVHKKLFITASTYTGNLGGLAGADSKCMSDANKPCDGGTYKAFIAANGREACTTNPFCTLAGEHSGWILAPNTTYYRSDDTTIIFTTNANAIFDFNGGANSFTNSMGNYGVSTLAWSGVESDWTSRLLHNCTDYSTSANVRNGSSGDISRTDEFLLTYNSLWCDQAYPIICVEQ